MPVSNRASFPLLVTILISANFLIQTATAAQPLWVICDKTRGYTDGSVYDKNLQQVLNDLYLQTPPKGFATAFQAPARVYGLSLCRGDVSMQDCQNCVVDASGDIVNFCANNVAGVIWYDYCMLKYSNYSFFGKIDYQNYFAIPNNEVVADAGLFNQTVRALMMTLAENASVAPLLYATGQSDQGQNVTLYGMAQCSRDLVGVFCRKCLNIIIDAIPGYCYGRKGGRLASASCNIRYELFPFLNS